MLKFDDVKNETDCTFCVAQTVNNTHMQKHHKTCVDSLTVASCFNVTWGESTAEPDPTTNFSPHDSHSCKSESNSVWRTVTETDPCLLLVCSVSRCRYVKQGCQLYYIHFLKHWETTFWLTMLLRRKKTLTAHRQARAAQCLWLFCTWWTVSVTLSHEQVLLTQVFQVWLLWPHYTV